MSLHSLHGRIKEALQHPVFLFSSTIDLLTEAQSEIERLERQLEAAETDAKRYRRLRVLGCALYGTKELETALVTRFTNLDAAVDEDIRINPSRGEASQKERA
jgi:hypothetical protein